jgi:RNA polymerase sigma-70 factor, ECF subfamily
MPKSTGSGRDEDLAQSLYQRSGAAAYGVSAGEFAAILAEIERKYLPDASSEQAVEFCRNLRLEELVLARACAAGHEGAWQDFIRRYRQKLRTMALHITRDREQASELADSMFADLYGVNPRGDPRGAEADGPQVRRSKLIFYTGRGSLEGWLRTVMAQEFINRYRRQRHTVSLEEQMEDGAQYAAAAREPECEPDQRLTAATDQALAELSSEDRFVLASYFLDGRTLAEIARTLGLHESSISRRLDRVSNGLRKRILSCLRERGMSHTQATEALETDVRDLQLDLRGRLMQDSGTASFSLRKVPAKDAGSGGTHA